VKFNGVFCFFVFGGVSCFVLKSVTVIPLSYFLKFKKLKFSLFSQPLYPHNFLLKNVLPKIILSP